MNKKLLRIILTAVLLLVARLVEEYTSLELWQLLLVYLVPYLLISYDILAEAWEGIVEKDPFDEDLLMAVATIGALVIGFLPGAEPQLMEAVFVMLFFQLGEYFEDFAEDKARDSITKMMDLRPDEAFVERNGAVMAVEPSSISVGEVIVVKPGEKIPLDGRVLNGSSTLNTVALTGESRPRKVDVGDDVISGCVNLSGVLKIRTTKSFGDSTASKILELVENAGKNKSRSESFIRRFARVYTPIVVALALVVAFIPPFFYDSYGAALAIWLYRALTFLVVSCPCALVISIPLTFFAGIGGASHKGILIKGGTYMDALAKLKTAVFDKTGTLTHGSFEVTAVHPNLISETELLHLAAHVERFSTHPIAAALRNAYPNEVDDCEITNVKELAGQGVSAQVNGKTVAVGNEKLMKSLGIDVEPCAQCAHSAGSTIHIAIEGAYAGHIVIADRVKEGLQNSMKSIKNEGVEQLVMLTGDHYSVAKEVASQAGMDAFFAELMPADKVAHVERLLKELPQGGKLAFIGDGINDAPVLARADVGVAMGGLGSDAAIEAADVVLMDDQPGKLATAIRIARRTISIAKQNAVFAIGIKVAVLILATFGFASMGLAVFADVGVMVLAVLNAMRALK